MIIRCFYLFFAIKSLCATDFTPFSNNLLHQEGKRQFEIVNEKSRLPQYGSCWKNAVLQLNTGCKYLNENLQAKLALSFTDCFLQNSGRETLNCQSKSCLHSLSDKQFNAYTEFYTHTQSMCYFLQSQVWHEETEKTVSKLTSTSAQVATQLEAAELAQKQLLKGQKESITMQNELNKIGLNLGESLQNSKDEMSNVIEQFRSATLTQKEILFDILQTLSSFKSWAVNEVSLIDTVLFYLTATICGYLFTSSCRTQQARLLIFGMLVTNLLIERYISSMFLEDKNTDVHLLADKINVWIWLCRKIAITLCCLIIIITAFRYQDLTTANNILLVEIKKQNLIILEAINKLLTKKTDTCELNIKEINCEMNRNYKQSEENKSILTQHELSMNDLYKDHNTSDILPVFHDLNPREFSPSLMSTISENSVQTNSSKSRYNLRRPK